VVKKATRLKLIQAVEKLSKGMGDNLIRILEIEVLKALTDKVYELRQKLLRPT